MSPPSVAPKTHQDATKTFQATALATAIDFRVLKSIAVATAIDFEVPKSIAVATAIDLRVLKSIAVAAAIDFKATASDVKRCRKRRQWPRQSI